MRLSSGLDTFHGSQASGKFQTCTNVFFIKRRVILQNFLIGLSGGYGSYNIRNKDSRAADNGLSVTNGRIETNLF